MLQIARNLVGQHLLRWPKQLLTTDGRPSAGQQHKAGNDPASNDAADHDPAGSDPVAGDHAVHYSESRYLPVWESICERIPLGSRILEVGCGPAHFAHLLMDLKIPRAYVGFDVSRAAVEMALKLLPGSRVELGDARTTDLFTSVDYDIVVCTGVLGRIDDDAPVLKRIPRDKHVLATVPDSDNANNGRSYEDVSEVLARYRFLFSSLEVTRHLHAPTPTNADTTSYLLNGIR